MTIFSTGRKTSNPNPGRTVFRTVAISMSLLVVFSVTGLSQKDDPPPVQEPVWQHYRLSPHNASVLFPKLPVTDFRRNDCLSYTMHTYVAYADDVVYSLKVLADTRRKPSSWCPERGKFDSDFMDEYVNDTETSLKLKRMLDETNGKNRLVLLSDDTSQRKIAGDPSKGGFYDFAVTYHKGRIVDTARFFNSLNSADGATVIAIRSGADRTIGDELQRSLNKQSWLELDPETLDTNYRIVHKFKPTYTDAARAASVQGTVRLKVTLNASGAPGAITPVSTLPHGLTEQAVNAAKRIVFLPKKVKGVNQTVIVTIEYGFAVY